VCYRLVQGLPLTDKCLLCRCSDWDRHWVGRGGERRGGEGGGRSSGGTCSMTFVRKCEEVQRRCDRSVTLKETFHAKPNVYKNSMTI
jgi:hypothetical protein